MNTKIIYRVVAAIFILVFLALSVLSLHTYGVNWDEAVHFGRGQAILHYFLTGKKNYSDIKRTQRTSYFQKDAYSYTFFESSFTDYSINNIQGAGHPPVSDVLASLSNYIFYQKFGVLGDIEAYHFYGAFLAALLVGAIFYVVSISYGLFGGFIAGLSLSLTPLFLGESRFNIKDVPEMAYYAFALLTAFWWIKHSKTRWLILSAVFFWIGVWYKTEYYFRFSDVRGLAFIQNIFFTHKEDECIILPNVKITHKVFFCLLMCINSNLFYQLANHLE